MSFPGVSGERADQSDRRLAVEGAAALLEQRRFLDEVRIAIHLQQLALDLGDRRRAGHAVELFGEHGVV